MKIAHWLKRGLLISIVLLSGAGMVGVVYQNFAARRDLREHPMPGTLVDVGGYRMHIACMGNGSPTVVLDAGLSDSFYSWRKVQPQIATFTRVCSYDRAGLGYSETSPFPRTSRVFAEELERLLINDRLPPPYVLVGHSLGGSTIRVYANRNPSSIAGMIFVDSVHPDQENRLSPAVAQVQRNQMREAKKFEWEVLFGIPRVRGQCGSDPVEVTVNCNFRTTRAWLGELEGFHESLSQAALTGPFGDIPLSVLSHDPQKLPEWLSPDDGKVFNDAWEKMQEELPTLSTQGKRTIAKNSSHYIQLDSPDHVIDEVRKIVERVRR